MKRFFLIFMLFTTINLLAQEVKEVELNEVSVKGSKNIQQLDGQWYYPTKQQLDNSTNGYSLLSKLTLPNIRIDPTMHTITALSNLGSVQVRINDIVATQEDMLSINLKNVKRVEYIDNPGVRYGEGIAYVINFVIKQSTSGYVIGANLTNTLTTINGKESVYGKLNDGKSEFGFNYSMNYRNFKGMRYDELSTYQMESGNILSIHRHLLEGQTKNLSHNAQLTYSLSDSTYVLQAKLIGIRDINPQRSYSMMQTNDELFVDHSSSHTSSPSLDLYYHQDFSHHQSLTANIVGTYIKTDNENEMNEGGKYSYSTMGKTWTLWSEAIYENQLKPFTLSTGIQYHQKYYNNVYVGDANATNNMHSSNIYLYGQLKGKIDKLGYMGGLGANRQYFRQADTHYNFWLFRPKFTITYPLTDRLKLKYDFEISQHVSQIALVSDVNIKRNALETIMGNPNIKPNRTTHHDLRITYSTPRLTTELQGYYRLNAHCNMEKYIRDNGHFYHTQTNADNSCNFFFIQSYNRLEIIPEHLSATLYGGIYRFFNYGEDYTHTYTAFNGGASMETYIGKWTFTAYFDSGWNFMEGEHQGHQAPAWYLTASYRMKHLTISLYAQHPFCPTPRVETTELMNRYIHKEAKTHNRDYGNMLTLNLSWNISSGKKYRSIQRNMEHQDTETGILKAN